ncbi:hypothetical protein EYC84_010798 [Monilinia fructicola]|uniref:Uncharacterized protein n=1 Tax=Monilinia fructicola TaxID=38448 RepID=A0A5M9J9N6_MONFR|nr:hypothetical protein EYC84_010798 [Monilinia fructicola]
MSSVRPTGLKHELYSQFQYLEVHVIMILGGSRFVSQREFIGDKGMKRSILIAMLIGRKSSTQMPSTQ